MARSSKRRLCSRRRSKRGQSLHKSNEICMKRKKVMKSTTRNNEKAVYLVEDDGAVKGKTLGRTKVKPHRRRMYRCCVPLCLSYGSEEHFVPFPPFNSQERQMWINKIPRRNWLICHNTVICRNHFKPNDIYADNDEQLAVPNGVPSVFPEVPSHANLENKYKKIDPSMLEISPSYALPETFGDLEGLPNFEDFIFEFFTLKSNYKERVKEEIEACHWLIQDTFEYVLFYQLDVVNYCPSVPVSILIDEDMRAAVSLDGIAMDPLDYTRHVPVNGKITHWNQLRNMLLDFGWERMKRRYVLGQFVTAGVSQVVLNKDSTLNSEIVEIVS